MMGVFNSMQDVIQCLSSDGSEIKEAYKYAEDAAHEATPCYSNSPSDNLFIDKSLRETGGYGRYDNPIECIDVIRSDTRDIIICKRISEFLYDGFPTAADIHVSEGMSVEEIVAEYCR
jgi:hypothetical protein